MDNQIFISYRRTGGDTTAKLICETLKNRGFSVFYDFDTLKGGFFDTRILEAIEKCNDVVLVLPPHALDRCVNEDDWVRQEIRHALSHRKNIIPVMLDGFSFPAKIPDDIAEITRYNGLHFSMEYFDAAIDKIEEKLSAKTKKGKSKTPVTDEKPKKDTKVNKTKTKSGKGFFSRPFLLVNIAAILLLSVLAIVLSEVRHYCIGTLIGIEYLFFFTWLRRRFSDFNTPMLYLFINIAVMIATIPLLCMPSLRAYGITVAAASCLTSLTLFIIGFIKREDVQIGTYYGTGAPYVHKEFAFGAFESISLLIAFEIASILTLVGITLLLSGVWTVRLVLGIGAFAVSAVSVFLGFVTNYDDCDAPLRIVYTVIYAVIGFGFYFVNTTFAFWSIIAFAIAILQFVMLGVETEFFDWEIGGFVFGIIVGVVLAGIAVLVFFFAHKPSVPSDVTETLAPVLTRALRAIKLRLLR